MASYVLGVLRQGFEEPAAAPKAHQVEAPSSAGPSTASTSRKHRARLQPLQRHARRVGANQQPRTVRGSAALRDTIHARSEIALHCSTPRPAPSRVERQGRRSPRAPGAPTAIVAAKGALRNAAASAAAAQRRDDGSRVFTWPGTGGFANTRDQPGASLISDPDQIARQQPRDQGLRRVPRARSTSRFKTRWVGRMVVSDKSRGREPSGQPARGATISSPACRATTCGATMRELSAAKWTRANPALRHQERAIVARTAR